MRLLTLLVLTVVLPAQQPQPPIQNARLETRAATSLERDVAALAQAGGEPRWVAWRVPIVDGVHDLCCTSTYSNNGDWVMTRGCLADPQTMSNGPGSNDRPQFPKPAAVSLEGGTGLTIFVRLMDRQVERIRTFSDDCPIDANNRAIYWLTGVTGADSIKFLQTQARRSDLPASLERQIANSAMSAISYHREPAATDALLAMAHTPDDSRVRGQALQALGRRPDPRVAPELMAAIDKDPDKDVKMNAVSGLGSQPKDTAVPLLIQIARTTKDQSIRSRAMNILGTSKDPRAIAFYQELLK